MTKRRLEVFMTPSDETAFLDSLRLKLPWMVVLGTTQRAVHVVTQLDDQVQAWLPTTPVGEELAPERLPPLIQFLRCRPYCSPIVEGKLELYRPGDG